jgi:hypothetical protein
MKEFALDRPTHVDGLMVRWQLTLTLEENLR